METLEIKPASRRARLWARLSDPDKRPRCWWFPPSSRRDAVLQMSEAARQDYHKVVQQAHEKFSETVRLAMLSLLGFALFCLLITFSAPDSSLLVADPTIKMPFADVQVSFQSFLLLAPFLLIVVTLYLHIFYGYWLDLETDYQHLTRSREPSEPSMERLPTLFSLDHPVPCLLTAFIFYGLVPLVLLTITWKAAARVEWGLPLVFLTGVVAVTLVFLQIRRCPASRRRWNPLRWGVMGLIVGGMAAITLLFMAQLLELTHPDVATAQLTCTATEEVVSPHWLPHLLNRAAIRIWVMTQQPRHADVVVVPYWLPRPLNIVRADLKGKWLAEVNLRNASASLANLEGARLEGANLQGANLEGATWSGSGVMVTSPRYPTRYVDRPAHAPYTRPHLPSPRRTVPTHARRATMTTDPGSAPRSSRLPRLLICSSLLWMQALLTLSQAAVTSAITGDGTLGTTVTRSGTIYTITGGTRPGNGPNLFHSFDRFSVGTGDPVSLSGPSGIANILSRVTGGQPSVIDGRLQATIAGANLYLLNPREVLFGPNASLEVSGSFHVSTADYLRFTDGTKYLAHLSQASVLTVAVPAAFGFLGNTPAPVTIWGSRLQVGTGRALSAVGGDIAVVDGTLSAPSGRVHLASVASPGEAALNSPEVTLGSFAHWGRVTLSQGTLVSTSSASSGSAGEVTVRGGRVTLTDGAQIVTSNSGIGRGGPVTIITTDMITIGRAS